jgi:hypothetical protein
MTSGVAIRGVAHHTAGPYKMQPET